MKKNFTRNLAAAITGAFVISLSAVSLASAHVVVGPAEAVTGERQVFTVSVPNEKKAGVSGVRIVIPEGVEDAMPTVHAGWAATTKSEGGQVTEIEWNGGDIPEGQRDDFSFKAQVPTKATELQWKAYQTYTDGTVVSWDQPPKADGHGEEGGNSGPLSITKVSDSIKEDANKEVAGKSNPLPLVISLLAIVLSVAALTRKRK